MTDEEILTWAYRIEHARRFASDRPVHYRPDLESHRVVMTAIELARQSQDARTLAVPDHSDLQAMQLLLEANAERLTHWATLAAASDTRAALSAELLEDL